MLGKAWSVSHSSAYRDNAGQFVCEELYFQVLKHHPRALFVHVPLLTDKNFVIIQRDFQKIISN